MGCLRVTLLFICRDVTFLLHAWDVQLYAMRVNGRNAKLFPYFSTYLSFLAIASVSFSHLFAFSVVTFYFLPCFLVIIFVWPYFFFILHLLIIFLLYIRQHAKIRKYSYIHPMNLNLIYVGVVGMRCPHNSIMYKFCTITCL